MRIMRSTERSKKKCCGTGKQQNPRKRITRYADVKRLHIELDQDVLKGFCGTGMEVMMEEKTFKTLNGTGALNIVLGVVGIVAGVAGGVLLIISGAKLLSRKSKMLF